MKLFGNSSGFRNDQGGDLAQRELDQDLPDSFRKASMCPKWSKVDYVLALTELPPAELLRMSALQNRIKGDFDSQLADDEKAIALLKQRLELQKARNRDCPDELEDISLTLSQLRAFFIGRFRAGGGPEPRVPDHPPW